MAEGNEYFLDKQSKENLEVVEYVKGIGFPVKPDELETYARSRGAPADVVKVIQNLPNKPYISLEEICDNLW